MKFGLTLPNRAIEFGITTPERLIAMAEEADAGDGFDSLWVGDSLLGKPRLESVAFLSALAARTNRVLLGTACMASFPLRDPVWLAYQWASLDQIARGRTVLAVCTGLVEQEGGKVEGRLYGVERKDRVQRLVEWIEIVKRLWTEDHVSFEGQHYNFSDVTIVPKPAAKPRPPIWIANNVERNRQLVETSLLRVVDHADGWQTSTCDPAELEWRLGFIRSAAAERGRNPDELETHIYHNINVNLDRSAALEESRRFLDTYYMKSWTPERVECWTAAGTPEQCADHLRTFERLGFGRVSLRITSWDQEGQLRRVVEDVLPLLAQSPASR